MEQRREICIDDYYIQLPYVHLYAHQRQCKRMTMITMTTIMKLVLDSHSAALSDLPLLQDQASGLHDRTIAIHAHTDIATDVPAQEGTIDIDMETTRITDMKSDTSNLDNKRGANHVSAITIYNHPMRTRVLTINNTSL